MMTRPTEPLAKRDRYKYQYCDYCEIKVSHYFPQTLLNIPRRLRLMRSQPTEPLAKRDRT